MSDKIEVVDDPNDPIENMRRASRTDEVTDRDGERLYFVRLHIGDKILATVAMVEDEHIDSERVLELRKRHGITRDDAFKYSALDTVRWSLEKAGFERGLIATSELVECRRIMAAEVHQLMAHYAARGSN